MGVAAILQESLLEGTTATVVKWGLGCAPARDLLLKSTILPGADSHRGLRTIDILCPARLGTPRHLELGLSGLYCSTFLSLSNPCFVLYRVSKRGVKFYCNKQS
jgi:hypothetical protein